MEGRTCTRCGEFKLFSEFSSQGVKVRADGSSYQKYRARCKECRKEEVARYGRAYLARHGDAIRERKREQWRIDNPPKEPKPKRTAEEAKEYQKRYYETHKEYYAEYHKKYYAANKEKMDAYVRKWGEENRERLIAKRKERNDANREKINAQQRANRHKLFAEDPERIRVLRREKKRRGKARDPQGWNAKQVKYNAPSQKRMVANLSDAYVRQRLARENDDSPRRISAKDIPQSLVEAKRIQLMILRSLKNEKRK